MTSPGRLFSGRLQFRKFDNTMKAIQVRQFGGPEVLQLAELPLPEPGPGRVRIKIHAIGVNPVDTYLRGGSNPGLPLPYTPGFDAAGVIEAVGPDAAGWKVGDRVYTSDTATGAYAESAVAEIGQIHRLPDNISFPQGAALNIPYATAYRALFQRANAKAGETVFVHGASGGVGTAAVQLARAAGLTVIGTGGTEEGRRLVMENGAHHVIDHRAPNYLEELTKLTGGRGPDIILEMLANVNLAKDLTVVAKFGRIVVIGSRGKIEILPRDAMSRDASVLGMTLFNTPAAERKAIHAAIEAGLENGTLRPVVGKRFPLAQAAQAHAAVLEPGSFGKIILEP